jgi:CBS domain containing-hemolysin-like protein
MVVRQVMTPRTEVVYLRPDQPVEEILKTVQESPFTRLPLCERDIDHVLGVVHIKDLFKHLDLTPGHFDVAGGNEGVDGPSQARVKAVPGSELHVFGTGSVDLMKLRRDILFMPERLPVTRALRRFQEARQHMAAVIDEYGATIGIVTLEDIIEEMVGDIEDEFDEPAPPQFVREGNKYRISGRMPLHELAHHLPAFSADESGVDTVGGYTAKVLGRIPAVGDVVDLGAYRAEVTAADARRVEEILLEPADTGESDKT